MEPRSGNWIFKFVGLGVLALAILIGVLSTFTVIDAQERGVITRVGAINRVLAEGLHFKIPFVEGITKMDIQTQIHPVTELAYSKDAQTVEAEVTVTYHLNPEQVDQIFREVRKDYKERLLVPEVREAIKSVFSRYTAQGILDNRAQVPVEIKALLLTALTENGVIIDSVAVTNLNFDDAYEAAVREKQVQEQNALAQINITKQEEEKKKQEILKSQALSEKTRLEAQALASQQGEKVIEKIYAEAALEAAKKWNGQLPQQMIPGGAVPFLNLK